MQLLRDASKASVSDVACAREILDTVPVVMRVIRKHMRRHRSALTVPQFRTLCHVSSTTGSSLSGAADFIGLSLPAMSRLVDGLVEQGLMQRRPCADDRRHVRLSITARGDASLREARRMAQSQLAKALAPLTPAQRAAVVETMRTLQEVFGPEVAVGDEADGEHENGDAGKHSPSHS